jgi:hypothetical protein
MCIQGSLWDTPSATSLPGGASGVSPCGKPAGPTTGQYGQEAAPALPLAQRAKGKGLQILVTSGRYGSISSASAALEQSLVNRLMERLDTAGSTLFQQTWKRRSTPLRRRYWVLVASERRTEDTVYSSVPTPNLGDWNNSRLPPEKCQAYSQKRLERVNACSQLADVAQALSPASVLNPTQTDALRKPGRDYTTHNITLNHAAILSSVPSPCSRDWKDTSGMSEVGVDPDGSTRSRLDQLPRQAQLADFGRTATGGPGAAGSGGQLDPAYSRWLMGVPPAWDGFACTAMQSVSRQRKHSSARTSTRKDEHGDQDV